MRKCNEEGVSYDVVRWMGCCRACTTRASPRSACARLAQPGASEHTVHAGMEWVDTSVQKIVYGTLDRTSHTVIGRPLPSLMPALPLPAAQRACLEPCAWLAHGNLAPYRVLPNLDESKDQYLLKLGDFGFACSLRSTARSCPSA